MAPQTGFASDKSNVKEICKKALQSTRLPEALSQAKAYVSSVRKRTSEKVGTLGYVQDLQRFRKQVKELESLNDEIEELDETTSKRLFEVARVAAHFPGYELTESEARLVTSSNLTRMIFETAILGAALLEMGYRGLFRLHQYWQGRGMAFHMGKEHGFFRKSIRFIQGLINGPIRFFIPIPLPVLDAPTDPIFRKQWRAQRMIHLRNLGNSSARVFNWNYTPYEPTEEEWATLDRYDARDLFLKKREFMRSRPNWSRFRRWVSISAMTLITGTTAMAANHGLHLLKEPTVTAAEYSDSEAQRLAPYQVRLLNETVPFPHLAIQIGDKVYSYGQTHMRVKSAHMYMNSQIIYEQLRLNSPEPPPFREDIGLRDRSSNAIGSILGGVLQVTGISELPRSTQAVTLNLTVEEVNRLQRQLELNSGKRYRNRTGVYDCATMIVNALKRVTGVDIPMFIDPAPSTVMSYLSFLKTTGIKNSEGNPLIDKTFQILESEEGKFSQIARGTYITMMEGKVFISFLPFVGPERAYMEARFSEEEMQYWDPETIAYLESEFSGFTPSTTLQSYIDLFNQRIATLNRDHLDQIELLENLIANVFHSEIVELEERLNSSNVGFIDLVRAAYHLEHIKAIQAQLLNEISNPTYNSRDLPQIELSEILKAIENASEF